MEFSFPVVSENYDTKKVFKIVWCVVLILFVVWGSVLTSYVVLYHKKQEAARLFFVDTFTLVGKFSDSSGTSENVKDFLNASREKQCERLKYMYTRRDYSYYEGTDWASLADLWRRQNESTFSVERDVDEAVGLPKGWTLEYLFRWPNIDANFLLEMTLKPVIYYAPMYSLSAYCTTNLISVFFYCCIAILFITIVAQILCNGEKKKKLEINSENCVFIKGKKKGKKTKEVPIKRITNVKITPNRGVKITATGAKIKMGLVKNRVEIANTINDLKKEIEKDENNDITNGNVADELLKFEQLFESGIISQEEFEAKKKQLLNL